MRFTWFRSGKYNTICDVCGFKFKDTDLRKRWDGLMVCERDWEQRHPQELLRPIPDQVKLPWTRPEGLDQFITADVGPCTMMNRQSVAGIGVAGCMVAGLDYGLRPDSFTGTETFH